MLKLSKDVLLAELKKVMEHKYSIQIDEIDMPDGNGVGWTILPGSEDTATHNVCNMDKMCDMYMREPIPLSTFARIVYMTIEMKDLPDEKLNTACYADWENVKNKLFLSPCKIGGNEKHLKDKVFFVMDDIALTVRILLNPSGTYVSSAPLTKDMIEKKYHITPREATRCAKRSFANMCDTRFGVLDTLPNITTVRCVLKESGRALDGAAGIFMEGIMEQIRDFFEDDFYILPIQIGYVFCFPLNMIKTEEEMSEFREALQKFYEASDIDNTHFLSGDLYRFQNGRFSKIEENYIIQKL